MTITLHKLRNGDEHFLYGLMNSDQDIINASLKSDFSKWQKMVEWAVKNPDDLYWKIKLDDVDCGYIGFAPIKGKISLDPIRRKLRDDDINLVLEIYLLKEYRGRSIAKYAYQESIAKIRSMYPEQIIKIFASTYITNTKAQRFFVDGIGMSLSHYYKDISVIFIDEYHPFIDDN